MPPQVSDDERSDASEDDLMIKEQNIKSAEKSGRANPVQEVQESLNVESVKGDSDEEDDDEEPGEDEFVVEAIMSHLVDEDTGEIRYEVKWEGYEKKSERTWEPEANLETAPEVLNNYLAKIGGKDLIMEQWREKKAAGGGKGKKRGRASTGTNGAAKKGRKNNSYPDSATPPAGAKESEFKPPTGSWEEDIVGVDACEGSQGSIIVYLTWKGGHKTRHHKDQVYKRAPQKMLMFYESHLVFKKNDDADV